MELKEFIVKFEKKATKKGGNYYYNIPIQLIRSDIIDPEVKYEIQVFKIIKKMDPK